MTYNVKRLNIVSNATFSGKTGNVGPETMDQIEEMENVGL